MSRVSLVLPVSLCLLFLGGCNRTTNYEKQLGLAPLPTPDATFAPMKDDTGLKEVEAMESDIRTSKSPALALGATTQYTTGMQVVIGIAGEKSQSAPWYRRSNEFYERAAKIKAAQLEKGDESDATGEVAQNLKYARQCYDNGNHFIKADGERMATTLMQAGPAQKDEVQVQTKGAFRSLQAIPLDGTFAGDRTPTRGKKFLVVQVTAKYIGKSDLEVSSSNFRLKANKQIYDAVMFLDQPKSLSLLGAHLTQGGEAKGVVVFEVDPVVTSGTVEYWSR